MINAALRKAVEHHAFHTDQPLDTVVREALAIAARGFTP
jgi:hypothetical protein